MKLADTYFAVGAARDKDCEPCVVIAMSSGMVMRLPECEARKLADDILRNANYLWPIEGVDDERPTSAT